MFATESLKHRIKKIVVDTLGLEVNPEEIPDDEALFEGGMNIDSMATLEIIAAIEDEFGITVEDEELTFELFDSVMSLAAYVSDKLSPEPVTRHQTEAHSP